MSISHLEIFKQAIGLAFTWVYVLSYQVRSLTIFRVFADHCGVWWTVSMDLFLGTIAWVAGSTQFALVFQQVARANPDEPIPQVWGRPRHHPGEIYIYRAIAVLLLVGAFLAWTEVLGIWAVVLILLGAIPAGVLNVRHNRRVKAKSAQ